MIQELLEILSHITQLSKSDLFLRQRRELTNEEKERFLEAVTRYVQGEPLAYILGFVPFFNCSIKVNASVLIPRPETEQWTAGLAEKLTKPMRVLDLCTGSGAIGVSLKKQCPFLDVTLADISEEALALAQENAKANGVSVCFVQSDLFEKIEGTFDLIVTNPPYISEKEYEALASSVKDFEPVLALKAPEEGLYFYRRLAEEARGFLKKEGELWMEIGASQGESVKKLFESWGRVFVEKDWAGHDRLVKALVF